MWQGFLRWKEIIEEMKAEYIKKNWKEIKTIKFIIVDDEQFIINIIKEALELSGYTVYSATNGKKALEIIKSERIDILITDVRMPEISGLELIEMVKEINNEMEVIIITGYADHEMIIRALKIGVSDFIEKPFKIHTITEAVKKPVERIELRVNQAKMKKELKEKEKRLIQQEKLASLGRLLAGVAHEINNPITYIKGNLQNLQLFWDNFLRIFSRINGDWKIGAFTKEEAYDRFTSMLNDTEEGVHRVAELVTILRNFGRQTNEFHTIDLRESINHSLKVLADAIHRNEILVLKNFPKQKVTIKGDSSQLEQVFLNVFSNSIDAMTNGTKEKIIEISVEKDEKNNMIRTVVRDTGSGISEKNLDKLFEPFFTTKEIGKGVGLGLSVSHEIIERHNGKFKIQSEDKKGTRVTINLPVY